MDAITELIALIEEFGTSVLSLPALAGIAVTAAVFALEIKWSRARPAAGGSKSRCASGTSSKQGGRHVGTTPPRPPSGPRRGIMRSIPTTSPADSTGIHIWNGHTRPPSSGCIISTIRAGLSAGNGSGAPRPTSCSCSSRSQPERASCACCTDARRADSAKTKRGSSQIQKPHFLFCGQPPGIALRIVVDAISFAVAFSLCMQALLSVARSLFFPRKGPA